MNDEFKENGWFLSHRPGMLGSKRNKVISSWDKSYGIGNWKLLWRIINSETKKQELYEFPAACKYFYEASYLAYFERNPQQVDYVCSFGECIDNSATNIVSGLDYMVQEAKSTHIQDIAVRACLKTLGRQFEGPKDKLLVIRSSGDSGWHLSPGLVSFFAASLVEHPSKCPKWAHHYSVEDFWQSNKWLAVKEV
jgi:hypothetical protein